MLLMIPQQHLFKRTYMTQTSFFMASASRNHSFLRLGHLSVLTCSTHALCHAKLFLIVSSKCQSPHISGSHSWISLTSGTLVPPFSNYLLSKSPAGTLHMFGRR